MKNYFLFILISLSQIILAQDSFQAVEIYPESFQLNSLVKHFQFNGTGKIAIPIHIPKEAKGFLYSITIAPKKNKINDKSELLNSVKELQNRMEFQDIHNHIIPTKSKRKASIFLLQGKENAERLEQSKGCFYLEQYIDSPSRSGYLENNGKGNYFIGFESSHNLKEAHVKLEVVAVY